MPYSLPLPLPLRRADWKVKIFDKERCEPPHATIIRRSNSWRINLRSREFMDETPDPSEVPEELIEHIQASDVWETLCKQWDLKYPDNPVVGSEDEERGDEHDLT